MTEQIVRNRKYFKPLHNYFFGPLMILATIDFFFGVFWDSGLTAIVANALFAFDTSEYAGIHVSYFIYLKTTTVVTGLALIYSVPILEKLLHIYLLPRKVPFLTEVKNVFMEYLFKT